MIIFDKIWRTITELNFTFIIFLNNSMALSELESFEKLSFEKINKSEIFFFETILRTIIEYFFRICIYNC